MTAYSGCSSVDLTGMSSQVDLGDLRAFIAVAECGAFHEAADQLSISQCAPTARITSGGGFHPERFRLLR